MDWNGTKGGMQSRQTLRIKSMFLQLEMKNLIQYALSISWN